MAEKRWLISEEGHVDEFCGINCQEYKLFNRITCAVQVFIVIPISIAMIVIGASFLDKCEGEPFIPIYNIGMGALLILISLLIWPHFYCISVGGDCPRCCVSCDIIIALISLGWFIAGNVVIYRNAYRPDNCDSTLYYFSFWLLTSFYILLSPIIVFALGYGIFKCAKLCLW
ncbi:uncharacterized protein [Ptychodera flava]|uniref:uncharacterized protein n=1 Tax=Ptychodera flava TaxID=63121 RepID=UPI00396A65C2